MMSATTNPGPLGPHLMSEHHMQLPPQVPPQSVSAPPAESATPVKRKRGRPKGTGKNQLAAAAGLDLSQLPPPTITMTEDGKTKRPVGRPRKDGLPAGSVVTKKRKQLDGTPAPSNESLALGNTFTPYPRPGWGQYPPPSNSSIGQDAGPGPSRPRDGRSNQDSDWFPLFQKSKPEFLRSLVTLVSTIRDNIPNTRLSLEDSFKAQISNLTTLRPQSTSSQHPGPIGPPIPVLYSTLKTFWLPCSPPYFGLTASTTLGRPAQPYRFFYWDPLPLTFNGIPCPFCHSPLLNNGRIRTGPMKIYDLENPFWIIGCEYACNSAGCAGPPMSNSPNHPRSPKRFASTDSTILRIIPSQLRAELPAVLFTDPSSVDRGSGENTWNWSLGGVSNSVWNLVHACMNQGMGKTEVLELLRTTQLGAPIPSDQPENEPSKGEAEESIDEPQQVHCPPPVIPDSGGQGPSLSQSQASQTHTHEQDSANTTQNSLNNNRRNNVLTAGSSHPPVIAQSHPTVAEPPNPPARHIRPPSGPPHAENGNGNSLQLPQPLPQQQHQQRQQQPHSPMFSYPSPSPSQEPQSSPMPPFSYRQYGYHPPGPLPFPPAPAAQQSMQRPDSSVYNLAPPEPNHPHPSVSMHGGTVHTLSLSDPDKASPSRRARHCYRCGSADCKGKGGRVFCQNPCRDCHKIECKGRNSRRPEKACNEAWP